MHVPCFSLEYYIINEVVVKSYACNAEGFSSPNGYKVYRPFLTSRHPVCMLFKSVLYITSSDIEAILGSIPLIRSNNILLNND